MRTSSLFLLAALLFSACDGSINAEYRLEYVIESYQEVGQPLAPVFVLRNLGMDEPFDTSRVAITNAQVEVHLLREDNVSVEQTFALTYVPGTAGRYALAGAPNVLPLRRYRVEVRIPGYDPVISSETLTPGAFTLIAASSDSARYGRLDQIITFNVTPPVYPGRQAVFVFTTESLLDTLTINDAVPFARAFFEDSERIIPEDLRIGSSPLLNERTYRRDANDNLLIELPWIAVVFYGPNRVTARAVDNNLNDYLRSLNTQQGGSTLSPGEIPNVLDRVENGFGIFGSFSSVSRVVYVRR